MYRRFYLGMLIAAILYPSIVFGSRLTDEFTDQDYNLNPSWTVSSGSFSANGTNIGNLQPQAGQLNFGTTSGTAIYLDLGDTQANTVTTSSLKLRQSNQSAGSYLFSIKLLDTVTGGYYQIYCSPNSAYFGTSGFALYRTGGNWVGAGSAGACLRSDTLFQTIVVTFDPSSGVVVTKNGTTIASCTNVANLTRVDRIELCNISGTISWFVDGVQVNYTLAPLRDPSPLLQAQLNEEELQNTFQLGMFYCGTLPGNFNTEFDSFYNHYLNQTLMGQLATNNWNSALASGETYDINVALGIASSFGNPLPWNDHAALHTAVQNRLASTDLDATSLQGYYLFDEPIASDASDMAHLRQTLFEEDPAHAAFACVIGRESQLNGCYSAMLPHDVMLIDPYGAGTGKQTGNFSDMYYMNEDMVTYIDRAKSYIHSLDDTPLWTILQTHQCKSWNREPTDNEIRAMSWLSVAHGAKGLLWFIWQSYVDWGLGLKDDATAYAEVASLCQDFSTLQEPLVNLTKVTNIASISGGDSDSLSSPLMQDCDFWLQNGAVRSSDASASDGSSASMSNTSTAWNIQWHWGQPGFVSGESYSLYARVKIAKTGSSGDAMKIGVWNSTTASHRVLNTITAASMSDMVYQDVLVGTFTPSLTQNEYVYVAGTNNAANVPTIYVDKMWFTGSNVKAYTSGDVQTFIMDGPMRTDDVDVFAQESSMSLWGDAVKVSDWGASDGEAVQMYNDSTGWNAQWIWSTSGFTAGKEYELWARVKVTHAAGTPTGNAYEAGIWDSTTSSLKARRFIAASATANGVYQNIKIGSIVPQANQRVYVAETNNAANISYIYVDKFWFVGRQTAQDDNFSLWGNAQYYYDDDASNGMCAGMANNTTGWNVHWRWGDRTIFEPGIKYDLYAVVKVDHVVNEFTNPTGNAFKFGVDDTGSATYPIAQTNVPVSISKDMVYRTYKLGSFVPESDQYAFIAGVNNAANVSSIYVDKFFFIAQGDSYMIAVNHNVTTAKTLTVSFPRSAVDRYGQGNVSASNVLTGSNISLTGTTTLSLTQANVPAGSGVVIRLKSTP